MKTVVIVLHVVCEEEEEEDKAKKKKKRGVCDLEMRERGWVVGQLGMGK